jgi:hypothetical protein
MRFLRTYWSVFVALALVMSAVTLVHPSYAAAPISAHARIVPTGSPNSTGGGGGGCGSDTSEPNVEALTVSTGTSTWQWCPSGTTIYGSYVFDSSQTVTVYSSSKAEINSETVSSGNWIGTASAVYGPYALSGGGSGTDWDALVCDPISETFTTSPNLTFTGISNSEPLETNQMLWTGTSTTNCPSGASTADNYTTFTVN